MRETRIIGVYHDELKFQVLLLFNRIPTRALVRIFDAKMLFSKMFSSTLILLFFWRIEFDLKFVTLNWKTDINSLAWIIYIYRSVFPLSVKKISKAKYFVDWSYQTILFIIVDWIMENILSYITYIRAMYSYFTTSIKNLDTQTKWCYDP